VLQCVLQCVAVTGYCIVLQSVAVWELVLQRDGS